MQWIWTKPHDDVDFNVCNQILVFESIEVRWVKTPKLPPRRSAPSTSPPNCCYPLRGNNNGHCHCISFTTLTAWQSPLITAVSGGLPATWWPAPQQRHGDCLRELHPELWRKTKSLSSICSSHWLQTTGCMHHCDYICMCWAWISNRMQMGLRCDVNNLLCWLGIEWLRDKVTPKEQNSGCIQDLVMWPRERIWCTILQCVLY